MSEAAKPAWPKTPDGTTDWEVVFEDETNGLIPLVMQADSPTTLGKSTYFLISRLFTRKSDEQNVADLLARLQAIITEGGETTDIETKKKQVAGLLRGIKEERQQKAAEHIRRKKRGDAIERRARSSRIKKRLLMAGVIAVLVVLAIGLGAVSAALFLDDKITTSVSADFTPSPPDPTQAAETTNGDVTAPTTDEAAPPAPPPVKRYVLLNTIGWTFAPDGKKPRTIHYSPLIELADMDDFPGVCRYLPSILDIMNQAMSARFSRNAQPDTTALAMANTYAVSALNEKLGEGTIRAFSFSRDIEGRARENTRQPCRLYPPMEIPKP